MKIVNHAVEIKYWCLLSNSTDKQKTRNLIWFPIYLLSDLLIKSEAGQDGQSEYHHSQTVVSQEVDQHTVKWLHIILKQRTHI